MDIYFFVSNVIIPVFVTIISVVITAYINGKNKKEKLIVIYSKDEKKEEQESDIIYKNYKMNIQFEEEFKKFLEQNNYSCTNYIEDLLLKTYKIYSKNDYEIYYSIIESDESNISNMLKFFKNDYSFMFHVKRFEAFYNNSLWSFKVINIGKSDVYNLNIDFCNISSKNTIFFKDLLKFNEFHELSIIYFDFGIRINSFDFGYNIPFDFGYSKYTSTEFDLVKKSKYNNKNEILFKLSYLNSKAKKKEFYFCSKQINKKYI